MPSDRVGSEIPPEEPERLDELTGRDAEEFRADDYEIPDFEDQDIIVPDGDETDAQYVDDTDQCFWCAGTGEIRADPIQRLLGFDEFYECPECGGSGEKVRRAEWR